MRPSEIETGAANEDTLAGELETAQAETLAGSGEPAPPGYAGTDALELPPRLGPYMLLAKLGAGAMGVVHAAYDTRLDRKVALKLLLARASEDGQRRLLREAQAMAKLSHPNIVQIYEIGEREGDPDTGAEGFTYIVMEFVAGRTLRAWLKAEERSHEQILAVMKGAGRGLAAAHAEGLIHRDFKPDNVMVGGSGEDARPLVMDFGLARGTLTEAAPQTAESSRELALDVGVATFNELSHDLTATGALMGTPAYMSPEQYAGREADARADQFAFCVTLWEALYGGRPFRGASLVELLQAVTAGELPDKPRSEVPSWIHAVIVRGLAVDPEQRWPSMQALLEALDSDPTKRRRSWILAGASLALVAALVAGFEIHDRRGRARAEAACEQAGEAIAADWNQARKAELGERFAGPSPAGASVWAHAEPVMDAYAERWSELRTEVCRAEALEARLDPDERAAIDACLEGRRQAFVGLLAAWEQLDDDRLTLATPSAAQLPDLELCQNPVWLAHRMAAPAELDEEIAEQRHRMQRAHGRFLAGEYDHAIGEYEAVEARARELGWRPLLAEAAKAHGYVLELAGQPEDARVAYERAFHEAIASGHDLVALQAATDLARLVGVTLAEPEQGRRWAKLASTLLERLGLEDGLEAAELKMAQSQLHSIAGDFEAALADARRASEIRSTLQGPDSLGAASSLNNIGAVLWQQGRYDEALDHFRRALAAREAVLGPDHPAVAAILGNVGLVLWEMGELDEALAAHRRSLEIREATLGADNSELGMSLNNIGLVLWQLGELDEALAAFERAREMWLSVLGPDHIDVALSDNNIGLVQLERDELEPALASLSAALDIRRTTLGPEHAEVGLSLNNVGYALQRLGRLDEALSHYREAERIQRAALGDSHSDLARTLSNRAAVLIELGRPAEAREPLERAAAMVEATLGRDDSSYAGLQSRLAELAFVLEQPDEAVALAEDTLELDGLQELDRARAEFVLARAELERGRRGPARATAQAREARARLPRDGDVHERELRAEIDRWLAAHRG